MLRITSIYGGSLVRSASSSAESHTLLTTRLFSTNSDKSEKPTPEAKDGAGDNLRAGADAISKRKKTQAELDEELRQKLEGLAGDGGDAGLELEDGRPVSMKRGVKNNMFRYI